MRPDNRFIPSPYTPDLNDQYRYQRERERQRQLELERRGNRYSPNDGYPSGDGVVISVDGQSRPDYDKMIKDNFKFTQDNYAAGLREAAEKGVPAVVIFGGWENNNSRSLIQESLPQARQGAGKNAVYIYVDRAKCKNPELAKMADAQLAGGHNAPISLVLSVKPGENGKPTAEEPLFRWQGGHSSMIDSFNQSIGQAQAKMESYKGQFNLEAPAQSPKDDDENSAPTPQPPDFVAPVEPLTPQINFAPARSAQLFEPVAMMPRSHQAHRGIMQAMQSPPQAESDFDFYNGLTSSSIYGRSAWETAALEPKARDRKSSEEEDAQRRRLRKMAAEESELADFEYSPSSLS